MGRFSWQDGIIGIDAEPETDSNHQILIDLGKTLERMLTLAPDEVSQRLPPMSLNLMIALNFGGYSLLTCSPRLNGRPVQEDDAQIAGGGRV